MMTLFHTKHFESGLLKGLNVPCAITFPDNRVAVYAKAFHKGKKGRDVITKDRWIIVDASFQNYQR